MTALDWAHAVLSLPSSSKATSIRPNDLPASPDELARAWCEQLTSVSATDQTRTLLLRALRVSRLLESHGLIIRTTTPLLVSNSASIRLHAAGALLLYTSVASAQTLGNLHSQIVSTISRALAPLRLTIHSSSSPTLSGRFVSTCFRILCILIPKVTDLSPDDFDVVASLVASWVYYGPSLGGNASPGPNRGRGVGPALSFGVMSSFAQASTSPRKSESVTKPSRTSSSDRDGASEPESDDAKRDRRTESAQIRIDALACLRSAAKSNARAFQKHWHYFVSDSPYLRNRSTLMTLVETDPAREVRLQACQALEAMLEGSTAYLNIAQDRPTKSSFTSLSTKVGEIVGELHLSLIALLDRPRGLDQQDLRLAVLSLAKRLASCSPYGRMKRSLAGPLARSVLTNIKDTEPTIVAAAFSTLAAIARRCTATSNLQIKAWDEEVQAALEQLDRGAAEPLDVAIWELLASTARLLPERDWTVAMSSAGIDFERVAPAQQVARVEFLSSFFPPASPLALSSRDLPPGAIPLLQAALDSQHPQCRAIACCALSHPSLSAYPDVHPLRWAQALSSDPDAKVSHTARRVLGLVLRDSTSDRDHDPTADQVNAVKALVRDFADGDDIDGDLCWALANAFDGSNDWVAMSMDSTKIVNRVIKLLACPRSEETIRINCLRILGSMLKFLSTRNRGTQTEFDEMLSTLGRSLDSTSAKIRWNTCTSLSNALPTLSRQVVSTRAFFLVVERLASIVVRDPSYKVRIHATKVVAESIAIANRLEIDQLVSLGHSARIAGRTARSRLKDQVEAGQVPAKERRHVQVLLAKLDEFLSPDSSG